MGWHLWVCDLDHRAGLSAANRVTIWEEQVSNVQKLRRLRSDPKETLRPDAAVISATRTALTVSHREVIDMLDGTRGAAPGE